MKKNNIGVLITIIVLLCLILPGAVYGTYMHFKIKALGGNPNKEFYFDGKLYFYNIEKLIGTYTCVTTECSYASNYVDEVYISDNYNNKNTEIPLINKHYAFIKDGNKVVLYDVQTESVLIDYKAVKNYSVGIEGSYYIVQNTNGLWGMIQITDNIRVAIPFEYEYLGLINNVSQGGKIDSSKLVAKTSSGWELLTNQNTIMASANEEIINYSDKFIITDDFGYKYIYDYNGNEVLADYQISEVLLLDRLAIAKTHNGYNIIYNGNKSSVIGILNPSENGYNFTINNNQLIVKENDNVIQTIALS